MRLTNTYLHPGKGEILVEEEKSPHTILRLRSRRVCGKGQSAESKSKRKIKIKNFKY